MTPGDEEAAASRALLEKRLVLPAAGIHLPPVILTGSPDSAFLSGMERKDLLKIH